MIPHNYRRSRSSKLTIIYDVPMIPVMPCSFPDLPACRLVDVRCGRGTGAPPTDSIVVPKVKVLVNITGTQWNPVTLGDALSICGWKGWWGILDTVLRELTDQDMGDEYVYCLRLSVAWKWNAMVYASNMTISNGQTDDEPVDLGVPDKTRSVHPLFRWSATSTPWNGLLQYVAQMLAIYNLTHCIHIPIPALFM